MPIDNSMLAYLGVDLATAMGPLKPPGPALSESCVVEVYVQDAGTGAPIGGATVSVAGRGVSCPRPGTTDKKGFVAVHGFCTPGLMTVTVYAAASGYEGGSSQGVWSGTVDGKRGFVAIVLLEKKPGGGGVQPAPLDEPSQSETGRGIYPDYKSPPGDWDFQYDWYDWFWQGAGPQSTDPTSRGP